MSNNACNFLMLDSKTKTIKGGSTPTGRKSKLFSIIQEDIYNGDLDKTVMFYQAMHSKEFIQTYGDWITLAKRKTTFFKNNNSFVKDEYKNKIIDNVLTIQINENAYDELINDSTEIVNIDDTILTIKFSKASSENDNYVDGTLEQVIDTIFEPYNANEIKNKLLPEITLNTIELILNEDGVYELSFDSIIDIANSEKYEYIKNFKRNEISEINLTTLSTNLQSKFKSIDEINNAITRLKSNNPKAIHELEEVKMIFTSKLYNSILGITNNEYEGSSQKRINAIVKDYFDNYGTLHTNELLNLFYTEDNKLNNDMLIAIHNEIYNDLKNKFDMNILNLQEVDKTDEVDGDDFDENESVEKREKHGADKEALKEQGYQHVSKAIRAFIDLTTYIDEEIVNDDIDYNTFENNAKSIVKREKLINGENVFRILQNMMSNQFHSKLNQDFDTLFQIAAFDNPQVNALYVKYLTAIEINSNIREALIKELDSIAQNHITLLIDPNIRKSKMFNSNLKGYDTQQFESWNTSWQIFLKEVDSIPKAIGTTEDKRQKFVNKRVALIKQIQNKLEEYKNITYFESLSDLDNKVKVFTDLDSPLNIEQATGIKLSKTFIKYSIIHNAINFNGANSVDYSELGDVYKALIEDVNIESHFSKSMNDLLLTPKFFEEFNRIASNPDFDYNPYSASYQTTDIIIGNKKKKPMSEVVTRLKNIALANSLFDENILQTSFQNAAQDTLFGLSKPSFLSRHAKLLSDKAYRRLVKQGNNGTYLGTAIISNNILLNLDEEVQDAVMNDFKLQHVSNVTQSVMDNSIIEGEIPLGADFKDITAKVFSIAGLAYFADKNKYRAKVRTNSTISEYIPRYLLRPYILETSNTSHGIAVPVGLPTMVNGNLEILRFTSYEDNKAFITDIALELILNKVKNEYAKMQERKEAIFNGLAELVEADLAYTNNEVIKAPTVQLYEGYDLSINKGQISFNKAKAFKFFLTRAFFNESKNASIKALMSEFQAHIKEFEDNAKTYFNTLKTAKTSEELQTIKANYDKSKVVNKMNFLETEESKKIFKNEYKNYLINSFNTWVDNALVKEKLVKKDLKTGELTNIMLVESIDIIGTTNETANVINSEYKGDLKYFALDFYVNSTIWSMDFNELMGDDQSIRKDGTDLNKRIKGGNPNGTPIATGKQKVAIIPEASYQHIKLGKIEHADAQSYSNMQMFRELTRNQGRYTKKVQKVLQKVTIGLPITYKERMILENAKAVPNSLKDVYYNVNTFHKDSVAFLLPEFTSYIPTYNDAEFNRLAEEIQKLEDTEFMSVNPALQSAIDRYDRNPANEYKYFEKERIIKDLYTQLYKLSLPRHQYLHDLRMNMFKDDVKVVLPPTATKLLSPIRLDVVNNQTDWNIKEDFRLNFSSYEIDGNYWREVVEVNTGKKTITYFSQIMRLIEGGHTNEQAIVLGQDGNYYEISELLNDYRNTMGLMRIKSFANAVSMLVEDEDGNYTNESIKDFNKKIELTLKNSGSDNLSLELFGNIAIDKNIPVTVDKYIQLFLSHFDKGVLTQKATGGKYSLFSDAGVLTKVRIDPKTGDELGVITAMELEEIRKADLQALKSNPNHISEYDRIMSATTELVDSVEMEEYEEEYEDITYVPDDFEEEYEIEIDNNEINEIKPLIKFEEETSNGYRERTIKNASADATIHIAIDFNTDGEILTKKSVKRLNKLYIPLNANDLTVTQQRVDKIVDMLNKANATSLNIAGNGIYTMKGIYTQEQVDKFTYELLKAVIESPKLINKINLIRSGGQTGFDEAGSKAGIKLGINTLTLAPKNWTFRDINGKDIRNEILFKERFDNVINNANISKINEVKTAESIYNELGDKTVSENVVIKSVYQREGVKYAKSINGVFSMRVNDMAMHFGNPFSSVKKEIDKGLIATTSVKESVEKYIDWVINSNDKRAEQIRDILKSGVLKGKPIVYYKELNEPSHATALDYLINKYDWNKTTSKAKKTVILNEPKGIKFKEGVYVNQDGLSKDEQLELFNYLKPYLENQAYKTNKGIYANKMIGLGLRWDYKSNNSGIKKMFPELGDRNAITIGDNLAGTVTSYGYYDKAINGLDLGKITLRFKELISKATGIDIKDYDGAIINLYDENTFIGNHSDLEESKSAERYPVVAVNIGGSGNFTAGTSTNDNINLKAGAGYVFGFKGVNRTIPHSTKASKQDGFLPELTTKLDNRTYKSGSYRITITMRRIKPLNNIPSEPNLYDNIIEQEINAPKAKIKATRKIKHYIPVTTKTKVTKKRPKYTNYVNSQPDIKLRRLRASRPILSTDFAFKLNDTVIKYSKEDIIDNLINNHNLIKDSSEYQDLLQFFQYINDLNNNVEIEYYGETFAKFENIKNNASEVNNRSVKELLELAYTDIKTTMLQTYKDSYNTNQVIVKDLVKISDVSKQGYFEILLSRWEDSQYDITSEEFNNKVVQETMKFFGGRIPSQEYHSMIAAKVVDFLPSAMGDVAIAAREIVPLSGADFDIDSIYGIRKASTSLKGLNENSKVFNIYHEFGQDTLTDAEVLAIKAHEMMSKRYEELFIAKSNDETYLKYLTANRSYRIAVLSSDNSKESKVLINQAKENRDALLNQLKAENKEYLLLSNKQLLKSTDLKALTDLSYEELNEKLATNTDELINTYRNEIYYNLYVETYKKKHPRIKAEIAAMKMENSYITQLESRLVELEEEYEKVNNNIKEYSKIANDAFKTRGLSKRDAFTLLNKLDSAFNNNTLILKEMYNIKNTLKEFNDDIIEKVFSSNGLSTSKSFTQLDNPLSMHNKLVDSNFNLFNDPTLVKIAVYDDTKPDHKMDIGVTQSPAVMSKIQGSDSARNDNGKLIKLISLSKMFPKIRKTLSIDDYDPFTPLGLYIAYKSNHVSSKMIGPAALAKIVKSKGGNIFKSTVNVNWDNKAYKKGLSATISEDIEFEEVIKTDDYGNKISTYQIKVYKDGDKLKSPIIFRIDDELSTMISVMTDAPKWNDPYKLQLSFESLGTYLYLISIGVGINRAMLLAQMSFIQVLDSSTNESNHQVVLNDDLFQTKGVKLLLGSPKFNKNGEISNGIFTAATIIIRDMLDYIATKSNFTPAQLTDLGINELRANLEINKDYYKNLNTYKFNIDNESFESTNFKANPKENYIFNTEDVSFNLIYNKTLYTSLDSKELFDAVSTRELVKYFTGGHSSVTEGLNLELQDLSPKMILHLIHSASYLLKKNIGSNKFYTIYDNYKKLANVINTNFKAVMFYQANFQVSNEMRNFITLLQIDKGIKPSFGQIDKILKSMNSLGIEVLYLTKDKVNELRGFSRNITEQRKNELIALSEELKLNDELDTFNIDNTEDTEDADVIDDGLAEETNQADSIDFNQDVYEYVEFTYDIFKDNEGRNYYLAINKDAKTIVDYSKIIEDPMVQTNLVAIHKIANEISPKLILNRNVNVRNLIDNVVTDLKLSKEDDYEYLEKTIMNYIVSKVLKTKFGLEFKPDLLYKFYNMNFEVTPVTNNGEITSYVVTELPNTSFTLYDKYLKAAVVNPVIGNLLFTKLLTSPVYNNDTNTSPNRFGIESFIAKNDIIIAQLKTDLLTIKEIDNELYNDIVGYLFSKDALNLGKDSVIKYMDESLFKTLSKAITTLRLSTTDEFNDVLNIDNLPDDFLSIFVITNKGKKLLQNVKIKVKAKEDLLSKAGIEIIDGLQLSRAESLSNQFVIINADTKEKQRSLVNDFNFKMENGKLPRYFKTTSKVDNKTVTSVYRKIIEFSNSSVYVELPEYTLTNDINPFVFNDSSEIADLQKILNNNIVYNSISGVAMKSINDLKANLSSNETVAPSKMYEFASKYLLRPVFKSFEQTYLTSKDIKSYLIKIANNEVNEEYEKQFIINKIKARLVELTTIKNKNSEFKVANYGINNEYSDISTVDVEGFTFTEEKLDINTLGKKNKVITFMNENTYNSLTEENKRIILNNAQSIILQRDNIYTYIDNTKSFDVTDSIKGLPLEFATIGANVNVSALVALIDKSKLITIEQLEYSNNNLTTTLNKTVFKSTNNNNIDIDNLSDLGKILLDAANKRDKKTVKSVTQLMSLIGGQYLIAINPLDLKSKINLDDKILLDNKHVVQLNSYPFKIVKNKSNIEPYILGNNNNLIDQVLAPKSTTFELPLYLAKSPKNKYLADLLLQEVIAPKDKASFKEGETVTIEQYYGKNTEAYIKGLLVYNENNPNKKLHVSKTIKKIYSLALGKNLQAFINNNGGLEFLNQLSFYGDNTDFKQLKLNLLKQVYIEKSMRKNGFIYTSLTKDELSSKTLLNTAESLNVITNAANSPIYVDVTYIGIKNKGSNIIQELKTDNTLISKLDKSRLDIDVINSINKLTAFNENIVKLSSLSYAISSRTNTNKSKIVNDFDNIFKDAFLINFVFTELGFNKKIPLKENILENEMIDNFIVELSKLSYELLQSNDKTSLKELFVDKIYNAIFGVNKETFEKEIVSVINNSKYFNEEFELKITKTISDLELLFKTKNDAKLLKTITNLIIFKDNTYQKYFTLYKNKFKTDVADKIELLFNTMIVDMQKEQYVLSELMSDKYKYAYDTLKDIVLNSNSDNESQAKKDYNKLLLENNDINIDKITIVPNCN